MSPEPSNYNQIGSVRRTREDIYTDGGFHFYKQVIIMLRSVSSRFYSSNFLRMEVALEEIAFLVSILPSKVIELLTALVKNTISPMTMHALFVTLSNILCSLNCCLSLSHRQKTICSKSCHIIMHQKPGINPLIYLVKQ